MSSCVCVYRYIFVDSNSIEFVLVLNIHLIWTLSTPLENHVFCSLSGVQGAILEIHIYVCDLLVSQLYVLSVAFVLGREPSV